MTTGSAPRHAPLAGLRGLFGELVDLKRVRSAGRDGSVATRGFARAWTWLVAGEAPRRVMLASAAHALAAARMGDVDLDKLRELGLSPEAARTILERALDDVAPAVDAALVDALRPALVAPTTGAATPGFVAALAAQPRAGATCPGKPRLLLEPAESHADHCWAVAVLGVLLAPRYGADPTIVFLAGLSHHLHNAILPDSGFAGEMLLGAQLEPIVAVATRRGLDELPDRLRRDVVAAREILSDATTPEGRAFHAADVVDRVLELAQHLRASGLTAQAVLDEWQLVHDGPVKPFHDGVLAEMGLP